MIYKSQPIKNKQMRLSMKPFKPNYNVPAASSSAPHVTHKEHLHFSYTTHLTQQLSFKTHQYLSQHNSPQNWEGFGTHPVQPVNNPVQLGNRWMEYQGANDWAGLLDPLDDGLRSEILRYGNFVEAAYRAFDFDPSSPSYGCCKYQKKSFLEEAGFPGTGYRLTKNLQATSGIQLPSWAGPARSSWPAMQSSWIGYVAVCTSKTEIDRLGRRDVVIALRGTATCLEWLENLRATLAPIAGQYSSKACNVGPMVERGFLSLYTSGTESAPSLQHTIRTEVNRILELYPDEPLSFTITGHSLGAALATLAAHDIKTTLFKQAPLVTVISFGGPRVGNRSFRSLVDKQGTKILRIVNPSDLITKVPGFVIDNNDNDDDDNNNNSNSNSNSNGEKMHPTVGFWPSWIQKRVEDTQWVYAELGCELRLTSEQEPEPLPYYLSNMNLAKCHDLKTYLELVKGLSSNCPVRASTSRLLNKQVHHNTQTNPAAT